MKIRINSGHMSGYIAGQIIKVEDTGGVPNDLFWVRRLKDASIDNCCEIVEAKAEAKTFKTFDSPEENE